MQVRRDVMDLIYQCGGESVRLPSNKELAEELGIARSTAQLELKLLLKEGFLTSRHGIGTFTVPGTWGDQFQAPLIGILDGDGKIIYEPFYSLTLKCHVSMELAKVPTAIQEIRLFSERENDLFEELRSIRCDALVCLSPEKNKQLSLLRKIQQYRPVIVVDSTLPGLTSIELDRYRKGRVLGEALLAEGRKRVLFIQSQRYHDTTFRGCRDLFAEAGIDLPEQNFFLNGEGLEELLKSGFRPQAVAPCLERFNYIVDLLRKYRIDLYEECRMATFMFKPMDMPEPIMLFTFPFEEFGKETVKQVKKRLADPSLPPEHIVFDFQYKMNIL